MRKKIIIGSLFVALIMMLLPSVPAVEFNTAEETYKSHILEQIKNMDIEELKAQLQDMDIEELKAALEGDNPILPTCIIFCLILLRLLLGVFGLIAGIIGVIIGIFGTLLGLFFGTLGRIMGFILGTFGWLLGLIFGAFGRILSFIFRIIFPPWGTNTTPTYN